MLVLAASSGTAQRIQGAWIDEADVRAVAAHWRRQTPEVRYVEGLADGGDGKAGPAAGGAEDDDDDLLTAAMDLVVRSQLGSTSMLQRKLRVASPAPAASWTSWSSAASSARPRAPRPGPS